MRNKKEGDFVSKHFRGEIWTNIDENVLEAINKANLEPVTGCVGGDEYSKWAIDYVQNFFKDEIYATFAINGTGANIVAMKVMLPRYASIVCGEETHINVYEAGAFEYNLGNKIIEVETENGKLVVDSIKKSLVI